MVEVQRGAVVDQIEPAVPHQQVGVARRAVDVADEGIEPDDARRQVRIGLFGNGVEVHSARQVVHRQVESRAGLDQVLDLRIAFGAREFGVQVHQRQVRHRQLQRLGESAGDHFGHQRLRALAGAAELEHVEAFVVGFHDGGHGAAFAQWGDVAGGGTEGERHQAARIARRRIGLRWSAPHPCAATAGRPRRSRRRPAAARTPAHGRCARTAGRAGSCRTGRRPGWAAAAGR